MRLLRELATQEQLTNILTPVLGRKAAGVVALARITAMLLRFLHQPIATADGLSRALEHQIDDFAQIEIVELGNIKDEFAAAIRRVEDAIG